MTAGAGRRRPTPPTRTTRTYHRVAATDLVGVGSDTTQRAVEAPGRRLEQRTPAPATARPSTSRPSPPPAAAPAGPAGGRRRQRRHRPSERFRCRQEPAATARGQRPTSTSLARRRANSAAGDLTPACRRSRSRSTPLIMVKSGNVPPRTPRPTLTIAQIVGIYKTGTITNWNQVGGYRPARSSPAVPQSRLGHAEASSLAQLTAANGGTSRSTFGPLRRRHRDRSTTRRRS